MTTSTSAALDWDSSSLLVLDGLPWRQQRHHHHHHDDLNASTAYVNILFNASAAVMNGSGRLVPGEEGEGGEGDGWGNGGVGEDSSAAAAAAAAAAEENQATVALAQFLLFGVLGNALVVLGLLGNTLSIVVLCNRRMRSSTSYYLTSLAVYDNVILLAMLLFFNVPALGTRQETILTLYKTYIIPVVVPLGYPLSLTAQMGSIYTCVAFTVERFVAVCRPLHAANTCTKSRAKRAILIIFLWALLYNTPRFFHYEIVTVRNNDTGRSENAIRPTVFGTNELYQHIYIISFQLIFMFLLPFLVILLLNAALLRAINRSRAQRQQMSSTDTREHNLTVMLVAVIGVFLVCQFPTIVDNILVAVVGESQHSEVLQYQLLYTVCTLLVTINSSLNFVLFCLFGKKFRLVLRHILRLKSPGRGGGGAGGGAKGQQTCQYRSTIYQSRANGSGKTSPSATYDMEVSLV